MGDLFLFVIACALLGVLAAMSIGRGVWPGGSDSRKWYDRAASLAGGILILLVFVWLFFFHPGD